MAYRQITDDEPQVSRRALLAGLAALASAAPLLAACGKDAPNAPALLMAADVRRVQPTADAPVADATAGMLAFAQKMVGLSAPAGGNWIVSPLSMAVCFAMARVGARGSTASQLDQVFGFPGQGRDDAFNAITRQIATTDTPPTSTAKRDPNKPAPAPIVSLGNALFTQKSLKVGQDFLRTLAAEYGAGARPVDFVAGDAAAQINAWVREQTAGRITKLFDNLDSSTLLVLANAVYFHGFWQSVFRAELSSAAPFTRADGRQVSATMMSQDTEVAYASVGGVQAIEMPYAAGDYAMRFILPAPGGKPADVLDAKALSTVTSAMRVQQVSVTLPKFDFETDLDLGTILPRMGLTAPFGAEADFSGIAPGLFVGQAVHRANITVDEDGTVAAAVTGLAFPSAGRAGPLLEFRADRPFAFMIVGGKDRVPLFVGQVNDPTAK